MNVASRFINKLLEEEDAEVKPIILDEACSFVFVKHNNLYCILILQIV